MTEPVTVPVFTLYLKDCRELLAKMPDACIDAVVTDPPYGLSAPPDMAEVLEHWLRGDTYEHGSGGFMGKDWDSFVPGPDVWREVYRVLKPGGHAAVFAGSRTVDLMGMSLRLAGFESRDMNIWVYGNGFPKGMDVAKAVDKKAGHWRGRAGDVISTNAATENPNRERTDKGAPITPEATRWEGWNTSLKPAHEPILLVRKPLTKPSPKTGRPVKATVVETVLTHGTGALNIDATRIGYTASDDMERAARIQNPTSGTKAEGEGVYNYRSGSERNGEAFDPTKGRWPANVILSHSPGCIYVGEAEHPRDVPVGDFPETEHNGTVYEGRSDGSLSGGFRESVKVTESVPVYDCAPDCPVAEIDRQSGNRPGMRDQGYGTDTPSSTFGQAHTGRMSADGTARVGFNDQGGASRFFTRFDPDPTDPGFLYASKASKRDRNSGLPEGMRNTHPTVKPTKVMEWLVKLITPPGGTVLDPFTGSGTTGVAATRNGFNFVGTDLDRDYLTIAKARIQAEVDRYTQDSDGPETTDDQDPDPGN